MRWILAVLLLLSAEWVTAQNGPTYANAHARRVVMEMINAHGGIDRWRSAPTVSYDHEMVDPKHPDDPWRSFQMVEQGSRRLYQDWPLDGGTLAFDGNEVWTENWGRENPPGMMAFVSYYFLNLPFITQDDGVIIEAPRAGLFPEGTATPDGKTYDIVRMRYDVDATGASPFEYYDLYIDKQTRLLTAIHYTITYRPLMDLFGVPKEVNFMGPLFKLYEAHTEVGGLIFPTRYVTYREGQPYGVHTAGNYSVTRKFDASRLRKTPGAVVDQSFTKYKFESN